SPARIIAGHEDLRPWDARTLAEVAGRTSRLRDRNVGDFPQEAYRPSVRRVSRCARRIALLRVGRQPCQPPGRRSRRGQVHAAEGGQPVVGDQHQALRRTGESRTRQDAWESTIAGWGQDLRLDRACAGGDSAVDRQGPEGITRGMELLQDTDAERTTDVS